MRTRYLGPGWELAKVRGSRFNQGDGLKMALDIGAAPYGNWSGCHATGWDRNAPEFGDVSVGDQFQKHSYIFGLLINSDGKRFVDEGWDFHSFTYAKYGGAVLQQPGQFAWQVFDSKVSKLLRSEYRIKFMTKVSANTLEELAPKLEGVNPDGFLKTVREYNAAVMKDVPFNHVIKDGKGTVGIEPREIELGAGARHAAVRRLRDDLRHHFHVRRPAHRQGNRAGDQRAFSPDTRALLRGRNGRRALLLQLSERHGTRLRRRVRAPGGTRCSAGREARLSPRAKNVGRKGRSQTRRRRARRRCTHHPRVRTMSNEQPELLVTHRDGVAWLAFNRPGKANALSLSLQTAFNQALREAAAHDEVHAVIVTGSGERNFSAGADLSRPAENAKTYMAERRAQFSASLIALLDFAKPVVAAVNGAACGAGMMIPLLCDAVVAADTARFSLPEISKGLPALPGVAIVTNRFGSALAADLVLSGRWMTAPEARARGVAREVVPLAELTAAAQRHALALAAHDAQAYAANKALLNRALKAELAAAISASAQYHRQEPT